MLNFSKYNEDSSVVATYMTVHSSYYIKMQQTLCSGFTHCYKELLSVEGRSWMSVAGVDSQTKVVAKSTRKELFNLI